MLNENSAYVVNDIDINLRYVTYPLFLETSKKKERSIIMRKFFSGFFKFLVFAFSIILQFLFFYLIYIRVNEFDKYAPQVMWVIKLMAVLNIIYKSEKSSYKISWIVFIMVLPVAGILSYCFFGNEIIPKKLKKLMGELDRKEKYCPPQNTKILSKIKNPDVVKDADLLYNLSVSPIYSNTLTEYLSTGEEFFERMMIDIRNAKKFIFMEYFIFREGEMFSEILDALVAKIQEGVEVYVIYDGWGCLNPVLEKFSHYKDKFNLLSYQFNPYFNSLFSFISFRDHRKITIIDGDISYCGGINIADEYINKRERFGHWKDMALRLEGDGTFGFTLMFLKMLELLTARDFDADLYRPTKNVSFSDGYVIPYCDGPTNPLHPAESIYKKIIATAKKYVYITTPYLDIDTAFLSQMCLAAQSGVDIRIIIPHIPDKKIVHKTSRSFYSELLTKGVRIYEYTPGFVHGKVVVVDDVCAIVGSINMDYRSLAWNYESAVYINDSHTVVDIKEDMLKIIDISEEVNPEKYTDEGLIRRLSHAILRVFAPLM